MPLLNLKTSTKSSNFFFLTKHLSSSAAVQSHVQPSSHVVSLLTKKLPLNQTHYEVLGLPTTANTKEIKKAFKTLSKHLHPDLNLKKPEFLKKVIKANYLKVIASYKVLSKESKKVQYDKSLNIRPSFNDKPSCYHNNRATKLHYGSSFMRSRVDSKYSNFDKSSYATGLNNDVPHFDYDKHLSGNLWFERRMIAKKLRQNNIESESFQEYTKNLNRSLEDNVKDTLNLHRFFQYQQQLNREQEREKVDLSEYYQGDRITSGKTLGLIIGLGLLTFGSLFLWTSFWLGLLALSRCN